jgi:uncharacterized damage-inducible protein DinB
LEEPVSVACARFILLMVVVWLVSFAVPANAQNAAMDGIRSEFEAVKTSVLKAANKAPEDLYGFRPTEEVFTFRKLLLHVAGASYNICAGFQNEIGRTPKVDPDSIVPKQQVLDTLQAAFGYCDAALAKASDTTLSETFTAPNGRTRPKSYYVSHLLAHTSLHYGNIVTYLRLKGMSPGD